MLEAACPATGEGREGEASETGGLDEADDM